MLYYCNKESNSGAREINPDGPIGISAGMVNRAGDGELDAR